eukprot:4917597-Amphidinium_carterae.1
MESFPQVGSRDDEFHAPTVPPSCTDIVMMAPVTDGRDMEESLDGAPLSEEDSLELLLHELIEEGLCEEEEMEGRELLAGLNLDSD